MTLKFIFFIALSLSGQLSGLLLNILIARELSTSDYGSYILIFSLVSLCLTFLFSWSLPTISFLGSKELALKGNLKETLFSRNAILVPVLVLFSLIFLFFKGSIIKYCGYSHPWLLWLWIMIKGVNETSVIYFTVREKKKRSAVIQTCGRIVPLIALIFLDMPLNQIIIVSLIGESLNFFYLWGIEREDIGFTPFNKKVLHFSLWQFLGCSSVFLINFGDTFIINHFLGIKEVGIYNVAYRLFLGIYLLANLVHSFFISTLASYFTRKDSSGLHDFFFIFRPRIILISFLFHFLIWIFAQKIIVFFYTSDYIQSVSLFRILIIGSLSRFWIVFEMMYMNLTGKHKIRQLLNIGNAGLNIIINMILVPRFGTKGAAWGTIISIYIILLISTLYTEPSLKQDITRYRKELRDAWPNGIKSAEQ